MRKLITVAGLPRAGSTLFAAIANQNPKFVAGIRSPMEDLFRKVVRCASSEFKAFLPQDKTVALMRGMFDTYYGDTEVVFDTNRAWMLRDDLLNLLYPEHKMILFVRNITEILNSFEMVHKNNPTLITNMYSEEHGLTVLDRCGALMGKGGVITVPYQGLKQYISAVSEEKYLIVEYNDLAEKPHDTVRKIYSFIGEDMFNHDFDNVEMKSEEYDSMFNAHGLHTTRKKVELITDPMLLPDTVVKQFSTQQDGSPMEFWRK